ncbi:MAG TPA: hypothetical protein VGT08_18985 [Terracidiphilus sp.]|nr:hypothetical protein [Terracidiphilus sp.]
MKQLRKKRLTLRSDDTLEAIANFCEHRRSRPSEKLSFRFLTTTSARKERGWAGSESGIVTWEKIRKQEIHGDARASAITMIKDFLKGCISVVPKATHKSFEEVMCSDGDELAAIIDSFEWAMESGDHKTIESEVLAELRKTDPLRSEEVARRVYRDLFAFVFHLLSQQGQKTLTKELLAGEIQVTQEELLAAAHLRDWIDHVDEALKRHESDIKELKERIPAERAKTFYSPKSSGEYMSKSSPLFDFNQTLRGRRTRLSELDSFLSDPSQKIALLPGRGGIGKTKLMRAWSEALTGWTVLWVSQHGVWHDGSINEIPSTNTLIIADDAHLYEELDKIISVVSSRSGNAQLKLLIGSRPSGLARIDEMLARLASNNSVARFKKLVVISLRATEEIAKEVLGPNYEYLASQLAEVSKDTPLITVVGGKLIARGEITPDLLVNHQDFRTEVFNKFLEERTGELPSSGRQKGVLLSLIAAVQPVDPEKNDFIAGAAVFLSLRPDQIHDGLDFLEEREVLIRGAGKLRIVPDLFADYLLELASLYPDGRPKGYADAAYENFGQTHLSNLLRNFGELDWRITKDGKDSQLLNDVWALILKAFRRQDAADRRHFLRTVQPITAFQPENVHKLVKIAMDQPVPSMKQWGLFRSTQEHILAQLPAMLGVTIYNEKTSSDAFARLWELSHHGSSEVSGPAQRTLKSAIGYERYKHPIYNNRVLEFVEKLAESTASYNHNFTPLDLARELLEREVSIEEFRGDAFTFTKHPVDYHATKQLRERALHLIEQASYSPCPRIAVLAVRSFTTALADFHPSFRAAPMPEEQAWQDKERLDVLEMVRRRVGSGDASLPLVWKIHRILRSIERSQHQSAEVKSAAAVLFAELSRSDVFELFDVLCTNEYEDNAEVDLGSLPSQRRRDQEDAAFAALRAKFPSGTDQVKQVEELLQQAAKAGIRVESEAPVVSALCQSRTFLEGFSDYALMNPQSIIAGDIGIALDRWRYLDRGEYARYGVLLARSESLSVAASVAAGVSHGPVEEPLEQEDLDILTILAGRTEPAVLHSIMWGLKRLTRVVAFRPPALDLIGGMKIGNHHSLASDYCAIFGPYGLPASMMTRSLAEKMFANLVEVEKLNDHHFDNLMVSVCGAAPGAIVSFFEARITRALALNDTENHGADSDYEAIPISSSWSVLRGARNSSEHEDALRRFAELMKRYPRYESQLSTIFWRMADVWPGEESGTTVFAALDGLLHRSKEDALLVLRSLEDAPLGLAIFHPSFALHVLWSCAEFGDEFKEAAIARLSSTCFASGGVQAVQPGASVMVRSGLSEPWQARATELLTNCQPGSLAFELFQRIVGTSQPIFQTLDMNSRSDEPEEAEEE